VAFDGGTLVAGDTFSIGVTSPLLQAAQDASITLGSAAGGGNPITITSATNEFEDLVEGLTVTVKAASATPVTIDVTRDTETIEETAKSFVERYNGVASFLKSQLTFDVEAETFGPLFGDPVLLRVDSRMRRLVSSVVPGASGSYKTLSAVGITIDASGKLSVNETKLSNALENDIESVRRLFATVGSSSDADVSFLDPGSARASTSSANAAIAAGGYDVTITKAAEKARHAGATIADPSVTPIVVNASNNVVRVKVNGVLGGDITIAQGTYASGSALSDEVEAKLNADPALGVSRVDVSWVSTGAGVGHFEVESATYGSSASLSLESSAGSAWTAALGFAAGQLGVNDTGADVEGTIGGEEAHGEGQILVGGPEEPEEPSAWDTLGIRLLVSLTPSQLASQGGAQGSVTLSAGIGSLFTKELDALTEATSGTLTSRERTVNRQIDSLREQIDRVDARIEKRRRLLEEQFRRLEEAISSLQAQGQFLGSQLGSLTSATSAGSSQR
jgi:flagellar hook-associated protein 2